MSTNSSNVRVAVTGAVSVGDDTATAPTDAIAPLGSGFSDLGFIGEDGVTETRERSTENIKAWQNGSIVRVVITEASIAVTFVLIETKKETVEAYYGGTVEADGSIVIIPSKTGGRNKYVVDVVDGDRYIRGYIASGEVTEVGDLVYANGQAVGYEVTVTGYPDSSIPDANGEAGSMVKFYSSLDTTAP